MKYLDKTIIYVLYLIVHTLALYTGFKVLIRILSVAFIAQDTDTEY